MAVVNGTEVTVKLSPGSRAKIIIDGAEFEIGPKYRPPKFYMKKYAFVDTPREETVNLAKCEFIDEPVQTGFMCIENIPPPPYDVEINEENVILPEYQIPYCDPPEYDKNDPNEIRRKKLKKYMAEYLPSYNEANGIFDIGDNLIFDEFCNKKNPDLNNYFGDGWMMIPEFDDNGEYIGRYWVSNFNNIFV